jgi:hypothetical protein
MNALDTPHAKLGPPAAEAGYCARTVPPIT